jgi:D-lactate dehydrogenase (cytochrome)
LIDTSKRGWKKNAGDRCREILWGTPVETLVSQDGTEFLLDLLQLHPEAESKIGAGVGAFTVLVNEWNSRTFWIVHRDATEAQGLEGTPSAVVLPASSEQVAAVVRWCYAHGLAIVPRGGGSGFSGGCVPVEGGVVVDLSRMTRVRSFDPLLWRMHVEAGLRTSEVRRLARENGLLFPPDPGAAEQSQIGGNIATNAGGPHAFKYGVTGRWVTGLEAVVAPGEVIELGGAIRKDVAGYDLGSLLIGSEGTLGIITEVTLRLHGRPEAVAAATCWFDSIDAAVNAVILIVQLGIPVARIELLDALQVKASNAYSKLALPETPMLFVEFHGSEASVAEQSQRFGEIAQELGGGPFDWATRAEARTKLWQARHDAYWAGRALRPGAAAFATDVCVPLSQLAQCVVETQRDIAESRLTAPILGHVGDGNFHLTMLVDLADAEEVARAKVLHERLIARALAMDGTCTGEHGVGQGKMAYLVAEHGEAALAAMRAVKQALDPHGIMNPGKIVNPG